VLRHRRPCRRGGGCRLAAFLVVAVCATAAGAAAQPSVQACTCDDTQALRHRLDDLGAQKAFLQGKLQAAAPNEAATRERWVALQADLTNLLGSLGLQPPPAPGPVDPSANAPDPACGAGGRAPATCLGQMRAAHQRVHAASCQSGQWNWQRAWTMGAMLQEEIAAVQAETEAIHDAIAHLPCATCQQFMIVVQVVTTASYSGTGVTARMARSLNGPNGIAIPIDLHGDGTFQGYGSGFDAGTADVRSSPGHATGQFGNQIFIVTTGTIQPGECRTKPCQPDTMHLRLAGATSPQIAKAQVTGAPIPMGFTEITPGAGGEVSFDLPAYVGASAQRTLFNAFLVNSVMSVRIAPAPASPGLSAAGVGASLLYAAMECRIAMAASAPPGQAPPASSGEGPPASGGSHGGGAGGSAAGTAGGVIVPPPGSAPVVITVNESLHVGDRFAPTGSPPPAVITVSESVQIGDRLVPTAGPPPAVLTVVESIHVGDAVAVPPPAGPTQTAVPAGAVRPSNPHQEKTP
jgi:hypothetical protein